MRERIADRMLALYKRWMSPLLPPACRYVPTCSEYAAEAIALHGALRGGTMALWRVLRCNPFVRGGYDPVKPVLSSPFPVLRDPVHESCGHEHLRTGNRELRTEN